MWTIILSTKINQIYFFYFVWVKIVKVNVNFWNWNDCKTFLSSFAFEENKSWWQTKKKKKNEQNKKKVFSLMIWLKIRNEFHVTLKEIVNTISLMEIRSFFNIHENFSVLNWISVTTPTHTHTHTHTHIYIYRYYSVQLNRSWK